MRPGLKNSRDISFVSARDQLMRWGLLMAAVYAVYLVFFPLVPTIDNPNRVLDIEMLLKNGRQWFILFYIAGLGILFLAYWRMLQIVHALSKEQPEMATSLRLWVLGIGIVCGLLLIGLYPITALDVVLYVVRARLWALYGGSPLVALPINFPQDPFIHLAGEYTKQPSPYGPLWELIAQIPMHLGAIDIGSGVIAMKIISLLSYIGTALLIGWQAKQDSDRYEVSSLTALTFFALNPLVLMQAIGNGHNDMLMLALMTLGLILWQRDQWAWSVLALTLASLIKITAILLIPLFAMAVLAASPNWRTRITRGLGLLLIFSITSLIAYRMMGPLPEVFKNTAYVLFGRLGFSPSYTVRILVKQFVPRNVTLIEFPTKLGNYLFLLFYVYILFRLAQRKLTLIEAGFIAYFAQLFLASTFRIWYPMWLIPFAALNLNSGTYWRTFLFSITAELSILFYYVLWRWVLHHWNWAENGPLKPYWDYWLIMSWLTVPWTFGIPLIGPLLRRRKDPQTFDNTLWI